GSLTGGTALPATSFSYTNEAPGSFNALTATSAWCSTANGGQILTADINGDGTQDLICHYTSGAFTNYTRFSNGDGSFTSVTWNAQPTWCAQGTPFGAAAQFMLGDFNGDGKQDFLCHDPGTANVWIAQSDGTGNFTFPSGATNGLAGNTCGSTNLMTGDFD